MAANTYGIENDQEFAFNGEISFQAATQFVDNEVVELNHSAFSGATATYNADLYRGSK